MGDLVNIALTLGGNSIDVKVSGVSKGDLFICEKRRIVGKSTLYQLVASRDFIIKAVEYSKANGYSAIFFSSGRKEFMDTEEKYGTLFVCESDVLFMPYIPLEISQTEYMNCSGKMTIDEFVKLLRDKGGCVEVVEKQ